MFIYAAEVFHTNKCNAAKELIPFTYSGGYFTL
jgi:hypothetical protein